MSVAEHSRLPHPNAAIIESLASETRAAMAQAIGARGAVAGVAMLDFPYHQNVGDTMIWLGELAHLKRLGIRVRYVSDQSRFDPAAVRRLDPDVPLLITGGGNFGDTWPEFQAFRERIVTEFPERRIVQLPQSIWFDEPANAARANRVLRAHDDFVLMVRDSETRQRVADQLPDVAHVIQCPDAAFGIGAIDSLEPRHEAVSLLRDDCERAPGADALRAIVGQQQDWGLSRFDQRRWMAARIPQRVHTSLGPRGRERVYPLVVFGYRAQASLNMRGALGLFGSAHTVLTDRLHAHLLAGLMGRTHVVADNSYGKIGALYRDYSHRLNFAHYAATPQEAVEIFRGLQVERAAPADLPA